MNLQTRRMFLAQAGAVATAAALSPAFAADAPPIMAIDTHVHFYDPTRSLGVPWPPKTDSVLYKPILPPQFRDVSEKHNVVGTVVIEASPWLEDNQWILDLAKDNDVIVGFVGHLPVGQPEFAATLRRFTANPLFRGLRVNASDLAPGLEKQDYVNDLKRLADQNLSLDALGGAAMLPSIARVAKLVPNLRMVIDHLPFTNWDNKPQDMRKAIAEVAAMPNVYAKVSEVQRKKGETPVDDQAFYRPGLDVLWESFGPDRVLYGSNWPVSNHIGPYDHVYKVVSDYLVSKDREVAEKYFWRNSLTAYRWLPRGAAGQLTK